MLIESPLSPADAFNLDILRSGNGIIHDGLHQNLILTLYKKILSQFHRGFSLEIPWKYFNSDDSFFGILPK